MRRAAFDAAPWPRRVGGDLRPQRRDMLAAALGRGRPRRRAARRLVAFGPAPVRAPARQALGRPLDSIVPAPPALGPSLALAPLGSRRVVDDERRVEIGARLLRELRAQLVAQHAGAHFRRFALGEVAEFERTEGDADQAVDEKPQVLEHLLDLAVLSLPQAHCDPDIVALFAVEPGLDAQVVDAFDGDPAAQAIERRLIDGSMRAHAIAAQPAGRRQLEDARESAVVGEQQQPFGVDVEPADRDQARQAGRQRRENRPPSLRIARGGDEPPRFVKQKEPRTLALAKRLAIDAHVVGIADVEGGAVEYLAIDADAAFGNPGFGVAAGANARPSHDFGDALALADFRALGLRFFAHARFAPAPSASALPRAAACPKPERAGPPNEKRF